MSTPQRRSIRRIIWRIVGGLALVLIAAAGWLAWWATHGGEAWLDRKAEERIHAVIEQASVPGYRFTLGRLKADARHGRLTVTDAELSFEPRLLDSLRTGAYQYLFAGKVAKAELRGLSFWRLLLHGEFRVGAIELQGPEFHYYTGPKRVDLADPFKRLGHGGKSLVSVLFTDTLTIADASATVQDLNKDLPELKVNGLSVHGTSVRVSAAGRNAGVRLAVAGTDLRVDSISTLLPDGSNLHIGAVALSRTKQNGLLTAIRITPPPTDSMSVDRMAKSVMTLAVDSLVMAGLDFDRSIADEALFIHSMGIHGLHVAVDLDKSLPEEPPEPVRLPPAALASMPFSIRVDTLDLVDAEVHYRERDAKTGRWGEVPFSRMSAQFRNITNDAAATSDSITGRFSTTFFDSAQVVGTYAAALDGSEKFSITTTVTRLPLVEVNRATQPLMRMQVEKGILNSLTMRMEGNARRAKGTMELAYTGLLVRVEPGTPTALRSSMFGNVMDAMLQQQYGGGMTADRERNFSIERDPDRSMLTYLWHATREGLTRNLVPEAKERMRTMVRTDLDNWKKERAARKGKK